MSTSGPRAATIAGGVLLGIGAVVAIAAGLGCASANSGSGTECRTDRATGIAIGGGAVAAVGLTTLIAGASTLSKRQAKIRDLDLEINRLKHERRRLISPPTARFRFGDENSLTLSWTY